jgi:hypothetical protein
MAVTETTLPKGPTVNLDRVRVALAAIPDRDLRAFSAAAETATGPVGGLLAWLEHVAGWELDRRAERHYLLRGPMEAMEETEVPQSLLALAMLSLQFAHDRSHDEIAAFLEAAAECLQPCLPAGQGTEAPAH